jgi:hypothetical protein
MRNLAPYETRDYKYTIAAMRKRYEANKAQFDALTEACQGLTVKEAMASTELSGYIPDVFTPEIIRLGDLEAIVRNAYPVETQTSNKDFLTRRRFRTQGASVAREQDDLKHSTSSREYDRHYFNKIYDWPLHTWEQVEDSPLSEIQDDLAMSVSKIYRRENQIAFHKLTAATQGTQRTKWDNFVASEDEYMSTSALWDCMGDAYVEITTRLADRIDPSQLEWQFGPGIYAALFNMSITTFPWSVTGQSPTTITGRITLPYGLPYRIVETGYFTTTAKWVATNDIFLVAPRLAARVRDRVSMRVEPYSEIRNQTVGPCVWERFGFYVIRPFALKRIGYEADYSDIMPDLRNLKIDPRTDDDLPEAAVSED